MSHPFDFNLSDLETIEADFEEHLTREEAAKVGGGILPGGCVLTKSLHEGGGYDPPYPRPKCPPYPPIKPPVCPGPIKPPIATTLALGEEGGGWCGTTV